MQSGTVIAGRYEIERLAGLGGMGTVYRARDRASGNIVALKLARLADRAGARRFEREARVLAAIEHPNVVRSIDCGATDDGQLYVATEWLEGTTLAARLARGALTEDEAIRVGVALADGLAAVHERGVVHRDVKPANVMLVGGPGVVLIDFGLARDARLDAATAVTSPGAMVGTPGFVSPEQARGDEVIDARADLYSLGSTLFACLTGRAPFAGVHVVALLTKLLFEVPPRVSAFRADVSGELDALIAHLVAKQPDARPRSADEVIERLRAIPPRAQRGAVRTDVVSPAEQRFVTVLLADGPARRAADPAIAQAIERAGADVEQLAGGTVAAVFSERSPGESAVRAARCALALRAADSEIALAIATGRITVAAHGPMGEVIDRAAGLLVGGDVTLDAAIECAPGAELAGEVLVDDATARLLETRFQLAPVPDSDHSPDRRIGHALRGELVQPRPARRLLGKVIPCVGRDRELAALGSLAAQSVEESTARAVLVTGEAGIGKSRVVHEFLARLSVEASAPRVWLAGGDAMRANSPLGVLGQLVRGAIGIDEAAPLADRQARLVARAEALCGEDGARVAAFLGEIANVRFPDTYLPQLAELRRAREGLRDQMLLAWLDFAAAELAGGVIVVVIEDLQWADRPTVEFVDLMLRDASALPLLVVATARAEIREVHPDVWHRRGCERIALRPLSARVCRAIVEHAEAGGGDERAGDVGGRDVERIVDRSGGNPFVLEEMIRANAWHRDATPDTVLALIGARLRELSAESRRVLRAASVLGRVFWAGGVARLLEADVERVESLLSELIEREVVEPRSRARLAGEAEYAFGHDLLREAAYATLTDDDRVNAHCAAGAWLEEVGEADPLALAEHFERGRAPEQALPWLHRAAAKALEANDLLAVDGLVERAIACGARHEILGELRLFQAQAANWTGRSVAAERHAAEAMARLPAGSPEWALAADHRAFSAQGTGDVDSATEAGHLLLEHKREPLDGVYAAAMVHCSGMLHLFGQDDVAEPLLLDTEQIAEGPSSLRAHAAAHHIHGYRAALSGKLYTALMAYRRSAALWSQAGFLCNLEMVQAQIGYTLYDLGAYEFAYQRLRDVVSAATRVNAGLIARFTRHYLALALAAMGHLTAALELLDQLSTDEEHVAAATQYHVSTAEVRLLSGETKVALEAADRALVLADRMSRPGAPGEVQAIRARALLTLGRPEQALEAARTGVGILSSVGMEDREAMLRLAHAEALHATGHIAEARQAITEAETWLLARAEDITDPELHRSFLQNVRENRRILELARAWRAEPTA